MKNQKRVNRDAKVMGEVTIYVTKKWWQIMNETGLCLSYGNKWMVENSDFKTIKTGSFSQCMDFIIMKWKNKKYC